MKGNYFGTSNFQNNISVYNPAQNSFANNNTFAYNVAYNVNNANKINVKTTDESNDIFELPPMEEDIDHLKNFNLQERNKIYHDNNISSNNPPKQNYPRSFSVKSNNMKNKFANVLPVKRNSEAIYFNNPIERKTSFFVPISKQNLKKSPERSLQSRYSSASEDKYHFMNRIKPQFEIIKSIPVIAPKVNYSPINNTNNIYTNNEQNNNNNNNSQYYYNNNNIEQLYSNKDQNKFSTPTSPNQNIQIINNNNIQNNQFNERESRFKDKSDYNFKTMDNIKIQNNILLNNINESKSELIQNKNLYNNLISGFNLTNTNNVANTNKNNYYQQIKNKFPVDQIKIQNYELDPRLTTIPAFNQIKKNEIDIEKQRRNTINEINNIKNVNSYFNIKNNQQMLKGKNPINQVNFNQVINKDEVQKQKKIPEIAVVTKIPNIPDNNIINQNNDIYNQIKTGINNNINKQILNKNIPVSNNNTFPIQNNNNININFIQNNINNINIKSPIDNYKNHQNNNINNINITEEMNLDELINQNLAEYLNSQKQKENILINTQAPKTHINEPQPQNQTMKNPKFVSNYRTGTNTVIPSHNFNPLKTFNNLSNLNIYTQAQIQAQPNDNYITYNKPESERVTITNDIIQTPKKPFVKKDVDVKYNDFDGSGYVKNYGGVSRPGKDSSGEQKTNQDALVCKTNINNIKDFNIFGVLDGHGPEGHYVSEFASEFIPSNITNHPEIKSLKDPNQIYLKLKENNCNIITQAFIAADEQLKKVDFDAIESGSTCCLIIHIGSHIICANSGDSRALVIYDNPGNTDRNRLQFWNQTPLSIDYKPEMPDERKRIIMAGGVVEQMKNELGEGCGPYRVWLKGKDYPGLAMSRSIGDLKGKEIGVIPNPGIYEYDLNKSTRFIVVCSDGVFEFMNNQTVMDLGKKYFLKNDASAYCHELVSQALLEWETNDDIVDDITAVVAFF